ncbi:NADP-dependent oxidoreductase domain-containing protein [Rhexocercosporidium sp. MPI-PUGE-AT-0058]|nr:NADP-dependent oxidoreductase domain-containing protein [Rhexocercosporidium sp. MPI-PUGE-AT-0058]
MGPLSTRPLGKDGPQVSAIGLGLMGLSAFYSTNTIPDLERFQLLDRAVELGCTFWDTADMYGDSEDLLGKWFDHSGKRTSIFLATKFGYVSIDAAGKSTIRSDAEYVKLACAKSLQRLRVDKIDLYIAHRVDEKTPIEDTVQAMVELKNEGKIDYLGLSEVSAETLRRACKVHQISAIQVEYSAFSLDIESEQINLMKTCKELSVAIIAYSPLGRGMLTGRFKTVDDFEEGDVRMYLPRFSGENFAKNLKLVDELAGLAAKKGCSPGQLSLAWLLAQGDIFPIPGTMKTKYLEENIAAFEVRLTEDEVTEMRKVVEATEVSGERYPEMYVAELFRDTPALK